MLLYVCLLWVLPAQINTGNSLHVAANAALAAASEPWFTAGRICRPAVRLLASLQPGRLARFCLPHWREWVSRRPSLPHLALRREWASAALCLITTGRL